jgi:hypothetical protein
MQALQGIGIENHSERPFRTLRRAAGRDLRAFAQDTAAATENIF